MKINWKELVFIPIGAVILVLVMPYFLVEALLAPRKKLEGACSYTYVGNIQIEDRD